MGQQIEQLARFVAETQLEDIPEAVRAHGKIVLLDTLGVILAGGTRPEVAALRERLQPTAGSGATVYAKGWPAQDPRFAALLNGIAGRAIELCEGLRFVTGQAAMQILPGVLAVGEHAHASGREMLAAFGVGAQHQAVRHVEALDRGGARPAGYARQLAVDPDLGVVVDIGGEVGDGTGGIEIADLGRDGQRRAEP